MNEPDAVMPKKVFHAIEGDRFELFDVPAEGPPPPLGSSDAHAAVGAEPGSDAAPWSAILHTRLVREYWVSEEQVEEIQVGFDNVGRITAVDLEGTVHMLVRVGPGQSGGGATYYFRPWPRHENARRIIRYPSDELARIDDQRLKDLDQSHTAWWVRFTLKPFVGALPRALQAKVARSLEIDLSGASWWNIVVQGALAANLVVFTFIIAPFVLVGSGVYGGDPTSMVSLGSPLLTLYLVFDCGIRYMMILRARETETAEDDEVGMLVLEGLWWLGALLAAKIADRGH